MIRLIKRLCKPNLELMQKLDAHNSMCCSRTQAQQVTQELYLEQLQQMDKRLEFIEETVKWLKENAHA